jgi:hypothetical protein
MTKIVKPAFDDPQNSVDLFDGDRRNEFGEMYCVAPAILYCQVNDEWSRYVRQETKGRNDIQAKLGALA